MRALESADEDDGDIHTGGELGAPSAAVQAAAAQSPDVAEAEAELTAEEEGESGIEVVQRPAPSQAYPQVSRRRRTVRARRLSPAAAGPPSARPHSTTVPTVLRLLSGAAASSGG